MPAPQVIVSLSPYGTLVIELSGANGTRRQIIPRDDAAFMVNIRGVLEAQARGEKGIGEAGAPTQSEIDHQTKHAIFPDPRCPHCQVAGAKRKAKHARVEGAKILREYGGVVVRKLPSRRKTKKTLEELGLE